ncbi:MAG: DMT family transporter [Desulfopila sp.]|jgi:drug/metabolite transporter (DMT)-like permease|nr:DMT family transporter [Desulfopila sp.]
MQLITYSSLVLTMFFWGGTFIAGRALAGEVNPANAAFIRFAIATIALFFLTLVTDGKISIPPRKKWLSLFFLGLTGVFSYNVFFFTGLQYISAGRAALIIALNPLFITIFAALFLKESLNFKQICGILLSLIGAVFVISNGHPGDIFTTRFGTGELALFGCVLSWVAYSLIGRTVLTTLSPLAAVFYSSLIGAILLLPPAMYHGLGANILHIDSINWFSLIYLGFFGTALGFSLYYRAIKNIGATRSGVFINLVPLFSILLSWILLGESIKLAVIIGGITLLTGVSITNYCRTSN